MATRDELLRDYVEPGMCVLGYLLSLDNVRAVLGLKGEPDDDVFDPIFPIQQDPDGGFPYIRYNVSSYIDVNEYWRRYEQLNAAIYDRNMAVAGVVQNEIQRHLADGGEAADRLNHWLAWNDNPITQGKPPYLFYDVTWLAGGEMEPTSEVGGAHSRLITLSYSYTEMDWDGR
jgi:hypothetical protein